MNIEYIDTKEALEKAVKQWRAEEVIGIDIECENNLHHYGVLISIIQVSTLKKHWIVDVIALKDIKPMIDILEDKKIQKIFHNVDFDFRALDHEFDCHPKNIFDTQLAAEFLGKESKGLGSLIEVYFNIKPEKKFQMADWTKRPIKREMLEYASRDTIHLIHLRNILTKELRKAKKLEWIEEEFKNLEKKEWKLHEPKFNDLKGLRDFTPKQLSILKEIYVLREKLAKKVNRPVHFIINNKRMKELALNPPSLAQIQNMHGVHPVIKQKAHLLHKVILRGKNKEINLSRKPLKKFTHEQRTMLNKLSDARDVLSEEHNMYKHLILSVEQMRTIAASGKFDCLRKWQKKLVLKKI